MNSDLEPDRAYLVERSAWLIRLRWLAVAGVGVAAIAARATGFVRPEAIFAIGVALGAGNLWWWSRLRRTGEHATASQLQWRIWQQLLGDTLALVLLLEFSGGAENPFAMLFALPIAVGAMLLSTRLAVSLAVLGGGAHATVVIGQYGGWLPHHGLHGNLAQQHILDPLYRSPRFIGGYLFALAVVLIAVTYIVRSLTLRYQRTEAARREHERVAQSRERLARIGELSAGLAHSIRNPIHGLLASVELLQGKLEGDPTSAEMMTLMSDALVRMEQITRRLLSLTRDDVPLQRAACDLDGLVEDTLALITKPRDRVVTELGGVGVVEIDTNRFTEALGNLVHNALHACRDGGTVTVKTSASGDSATIEVIDTGEGIAPEVLARVFDPFFTTKAIGEGSGLGLPMTRRIVEEHGGQVSLESELGRGTTVRLVVPAHAQEVP